MAADRVNSASARGWPAALVVLALASSASRAAHAQQDVALAQVRFERGVELYHAHDCDHALVELRASLALYGSPNPRLYIARCLREQGSLVAAAAEYARTASEARERARVDPRYAPTADNADAELARLTPQLARVTVRVAALPDDAVVRVGGQTLPAAAVGLPVFALPGRATVAVDARGFARAERDVRLVAGAALTVELVLSRAPRVAVGPRSEADTARVVAWTGVGVAAVGLASFATFWALAQWQFDALAARCMGGCGPDDTRPGRDFELTSNVSAVVAGAGAVAGLIAFVVSTRPSPVRTRRAPGARGPGAVVIQGAF